MKHIVLTGGGTAGHVTPNIAMIPALKEQGFYDPPSEIIIVKIELIRLKRTIWQISKT